MAEFLMTYDLKRKTPSPYEAFKEPAAKENWYDWCLDDASEEVKDLPNTTLVASKSDMTEAAASLQRVIRDARLKVVNLEVERIMIVQSANLRAWQEGDVFKL